MLSMGAARNVGNFIFLGAHEPNGLARIQEIIKPYSPDV